MTSAQAREPFLSAFAAACARRPEELREATRVVGGRALHARIAGSDLAAVLLRSFAPGEPTVAGPGLRLDLWDERATGIPGTDRPRGPEAIERHGPDGERLAFSDDARHVRFSGPDFDLRLDRDAQHVVGWVRDAALLNSWHRARPLQTLLMTWLADQGMTVVHAAMVARDGRGVIFSGPAHSGKSTITAICAAAGLDVLGDETIALEERDGELVGHTVHAAVKLRAAGLDRHPALAGRLESCGPPWTDEAVAFMCDVTPGQVVASARVAALAFPVLHAEPQTAFAPLRRGVALRVLTGALLSVEPGNVTSSFDVLSAAVARVPVMRMHVGADTAALPGAVSTLLEGALSGGRPVAA